MNKKQIVALLLVASGLAACATTPLQLVNAFGDRKSCLPSAQEGLIGKILPNKISDDCRASFSKAGYLPELEAGVIDIGLAMQGENIVASSLSDDALQQQPDLEIGDRILSIDGQHVKTLDATTGMLFGTIGSTVSIVFGRGTMEFPLQLTRHPVNKPMQSMAMPEGPLLAMDSYSIKDNPTEQPTTMPKNRPPGFLQAIKNLFSSRTTPRITATAEKSPPTEPSPTSPWDYYSAVNPSMKENMVTPKTTTTDSYSAPSVMIATPPPLIMVGDQVCRARKHFIDIGNVEDQRADRILVAIDHIQLIRAPYTEFHHFGQERTWSPIKAWQPCSGDAPLFLNQQ